LLAARGEEGTVAAAAAAAAAAAPSLVAAPPPPSLLGGGWPRRPGAPLPTTVPSWLAPLIDRDIASCRASLASAGAGGPSLRKREERVIRTAAAAAAAAAPEAAAAAAAAAALLFSAPWERTRDSPASRIVFFFLFLLSLLSPAGSTDCGAWPSLPFICEGG
jgi:hypothetical protein